MKDRRAQARQLREAGHSLGEIARLVGAAKSTISLWVSDVVLTEGQKRALMQAHKEVTRKALIEHRIRYSEECRERRKAWQEDGRRLARARIPEHLAGCMLYWGEGSKSIPQSVEFTNTDPDMLRFFLRGFLKRFFQVDDTEVRIKVCFHNDHGLSTVAVEDYWLGFLDLPRTCLGKTTAKTPKSPAARRHRLKPYGTCRVVVNRTDVFQSIAGSIQEYMKIERPEWLDRRRKREG